MGLEAECRVRHEGRTSIGKARLESTDLSFRGDFRLVIPFGRITSLEADGGELAVEFDGGEAIFELGAAAEKWARAIKRPKGRLDKLGVKPGVSVSLVGVVDKIFLIELRRRSIDLSVGTVREGSDLIFVGAEGRADLEKLEELKRSIKDDGAIWVVRPKGKREITEAEVMAAGKQAGLVDVKVVSFSETHTADKFVLPVAARAAPSSWAAEWEAPPEQLKSDGATEQAALSDKAAAKPFTPRKAAATKKGPATTHAAERKAPALKVPAPKAAATRPSTTQAAAKPLTAKKSPTAKKPATKGAASTRQPLGRASKK
jgi:hypothetical protein